MSKPRFNVLDVVEVRDIAVFREQALVGRRGSVTQIRRYEDGRYRYSIGSRDEDVGGIYDEESLKPTGEREDASFYLLPGPFQERDVVSVSDAISDRELAGREAVIDGSYVEDRDGLQLGIWIDELGRGFVVPVGMLRSTGERRPPEPLGRTGTSSRVSTDGDFLGTESYVIIDEISQYL